MQLELKDLDLPRNRIDIIQDLRLSYDVNADFHNRVKSILSIAGFKGNERDVARQVLLYGESLTIDGRLINPESYRVKIIPEKGRQFYFGDKIIEGDIQYRSRLASPYDLRGTSFFNPATLIPYNDRGDHDIASHLLVILG